MEAMDCGDGHLGLDSSHRYIAGSSILGEAQVSLCDASMKREASHLEDQLSRKAQKRRRSSLSAHRRSITGDVISAFQIESESGSQSSQTSGSQKSSVCDGQSSQTSGSQKSSVCDGQSSQTSGSQKSSVSDGQSSQTSGSQKSSVSDGQSSQTSGSQKSSVSDGQSSQTSGSQKSSVSDGQSSQTSGTNMPSLLPNPVNMHMDDIVAKMRGQIAVLHEECQQWMDLLRDYEQEEESSRLQAESLTLHVSDVPADIKQLAMSEYVTSDPVDLHSVKARLDRSLLQYRFDREACIQDLKLIQKTVETVHKSNQYLSSCLSHTIHEETQINSDHSETTAQPADLRQTIINYLNCS